MIPCCPVPPPPPHTQPFILASLLRSVCCVWRKGHLVALDIIRGLVFLHSNKVVHADLKAKNVLLTQNAGKPTSTSEVTGAVLVPVPVSGVCVSFSDKV